ncbi:family 10 glycosylhydrolase [Streptomyces sp. TRM 70351]|uniref:glycoside hydrolase family 10 protein n=1 Tax=Streptomyces sp. TRM 70351 TaxID=3116552 RepID=UPI002E7C2DD1|nr:family 10 glycosylhydrolase [Streptomyces sp. TRM 70351]MEE1929132.1 family 10 glycosylhydrolase [Streptomyces sp. TRM 70351]
MGQITRRTFTAVAAGAWASALAAGDAAARTREHAPGPAPDGRAAGGGARRQGEMRGMWVATVGNIDWPSRPGLGADAQRRELTALLDTAVRRRLNTVMLQVRPAADALWPSPHEPWSAVLTGTQGQDPGWDPLDFAVRAAHERGLALHGWFNPYRVANHADPARLSAAHPVRRHPDWAVPYGGKLYYNPGLPQVRAFVQDAMFHAVEHYDLDGFHWDDYFYPYPVAGEAFDDDAAWAEHGGGFADRGDWRRHNVNLLVREAGERLRRTRPGARFGVSPFAIWRNRATDPAGSDTRGGVETYDDLYADTRRWVRERRIDYVVPQVYWHIGFAAADYAKLVPWWDEVCRGTGVDLYVGEALYKVADPAQPEAWQDPAELSRHLTFCRDHPRVKGHVYFSARHVVADPAGAMSRVVRDHYRRALPGPRG